MLERAEPQEAIGLNRSRRHSTRPVEIWNWNLVFEPLRSLMPNPGEQRFAPLPPHVDFFEKPACQVKSACGYQLEKALPEPWQRVSVFS